MLTLTKNAVALIEDSQVKFIRFLFCGNNNVIISKAVHKNKLEAHITDGINISSSRQAVTAVVDDIIDESNISMDENIRLVPDWETLMPLPYAVGHARVMGTLFKNGQPWSCCPRYFLKRMIKMAANEGLEIKASYENEFFLLKSLENQLMPADNLDFWGSTLSMDLQYKLINDISDALIAQGVQIESYHPESGPGHHEISVSYTDALSSADQQIILRETVKAIAHQHNLIASFLPKIFSEVDGSGCHLNISIWKNKENVIPHSKVARQLSDIAQHFMAGVLHHLPALMALTNPIPNSYRRIQPHFSSGAFCCWGFNNREAAIRVPTNPTPPSPTYFELRTVDTASNPYLALGGVIAAGLDGIRKNLQLGKPIATDPGLLQESERQQNGIQRVPINLGESIQALEQDEVLLNALGTDLVQSYLAIKKAEWEIMRNYSLEKEVRLLLERY